MKKDQWLKIVNDLVENGKIYTPRNQQIKEIEDYSFVIDPFNRFFSFRERNLNIKYAFIEFAWYLKGDPNDSMLENYASIWKTIKNKKPPFWHSNYGEYIFGEKQFDYVLKTLSQDRDTRQASIIINRHSVMMSDSLDKICTYALGFRIRENKLNMSVSMRSNDFIYGFTGADFVSFTLIQELLYWHLKPFYPALEMGRYYHKADSFHIYERHYDMITKIYNNKGENFIDIECPKISSLEEAKFFMEYLPYLEICKRTNKEDESEIPEEFKFVNWVKILFEN